MEEKNVQCSYCAVKGCFMGNFDKAPDFCPTKTEPEALQEARVKLEDPLMRQMAQDVARTWKDIAGKNRIELTMDYANVREYKRLGLAFCVGLSYEAELLSNVFINNGFDVISAGCMCGGLCSDDVGLPEEDKIVPGSRQPMCNPIGQAEVLNKEKSDLNILLGLCVGDDVLFIKHSKAPVTVLAVKDYALAHNTLGALYTSRTIFSRLNSRRPKKQ